MIEKVSKIYVEGKADLIFFTQYISIILNVNYSITKNFSKSELVTGDGHKIELQYVGLDVDLGGIDNVKLSAVVKEIESDRAIGLNSYLIIDTDTVDHTHPSGGYIARKDYLLSLGLDHSYFFLIPNNNDDGNLESLLERVISPGSIALFHCVSGYINCIMPNQPNYEGLQAFGDLNKKKIEWFIYLFLGPNRSIRNSERNYLDHNMWDLNSPHLDILKAFILGLNINP